MPRQREFDPSETLQTAIQLFWEKGYYDSSVDEVVKRSGVAKYGIYGTFGTKRELFIKALRQFGSDRLNDIQAPIRKPDASLPDILTFFNQGAKAIKLITDSSDRRGCLLCNTGIELGLRDPEIGKILKEYFVDFTNAMQSCLERAVDKGELEPPSDIAALATYLVTEWRAVLMLAASGYNHRDIKRHLGVALHVLH